MYFPNTYNCIPLSVLVNLVIRLCTGSYIFTFIWCAFSGSSNRDIYIYWVVLWAGLLLGSIKFYLLCCAKEVNLYN